MRHLSFLSAAALSTVAASGAALAHPGHGEPVHGFLGMVQHWVSDPAHLAVVIVAGVVGVGFAWATHRRERRRAEVRNRR